MSREASERRLATYLRLGLGMAAFGSATPVSKIVTGSMPVFVASTLRIGVGFLALLPVAVKRRGELRAMERRDWLLTGAIALFGMFGFTTLMLYGMRSVSGVVGSILMSTAPAITGAASMAFLGDKPTWRKVTAIVLAVVGVLILHLGQAGADGGASSASEGDGDLLLGSAMILAAVCCEAAYTLLGKKVSERVDPVLVATLAALLSAVPFVPLAIWQWSSVRWSEIAPGPWLALLWYGAGTLALGTWLWYSGVKKAEGTVAAGFMGVMPASALILSYLLLGEPFRWLHLAGFLVVVTGVSLIAWEHARMSEDRAE